MHARVCVRVCAFMSAFVRPSICLCVRACVRAYMRVCMCMPAYVHACMCRYKTKQIHYGCQTKKKDNSVSSVMLLLLYKHILLLLYKQLVRFILTDPLIVGRLRLSNILISLQNHVKVFVSVSI